MGTLLKYLLYALIIVVIYLLGVGFYEGTFNRDSTVGEISEDVAQSTGRIIRDGYDSTKEKIKDGYDAAKDKIEKHKDERKTENQPTLPQKTQATMQNPSSASGFMEN